MLTGFSKFVEILNFSLENTKDISETQKNSIFREIPYFSREDGFLMRSDQFASLCF